MRWWLLLLLVGCEGEDDEDARGLPDDPDTTCNEANEGCDPDLCGGDGGQMLPGADCLVCHAEGAMPGGEDDEIFTFAGTVYVDEDGSAPESGVTVRIVDANDQTVEVTSNAAGNFFGRQAIAFPATVEVETDGGVLAMQGSLQSGACNDCHACDGLTDKLFAP